MNRNFVIADTHFSHRNIVNFKSSIDPSKKLRDFETCNEMDEYMVALWNETVNPNDKVYMAGDVVINRKALPILSRLNGKKVLIKGNHDIFNLEDYTPYFYDIRAYHVVPKHNVIISHIPLHPMQKGRYRGNIHGHLHDITIDDPWYQCVSAEQIDLKPILLDTILERFKNDNI